MNDNLRVMNVSDRLDQAAWVTASDTTSRDGGQWPRHRFRARHRRRNRARKTTATEETT